MSALSHTGITATYKHVPLIWPCPTEGQKPDTPTRGKAPVPPTRQPAQDSEPNSPTRRKKPEAGGTMTLQPAERRAQHRNLDKMRGQSNMFQIKEQDKSP